MAVEPRGSNGGVLLFGPPTGFVAPDAGLGGLTPASGAMWGIPTRGGGGTPVGGVALGLCIPESVHREKYICPLHKMR